jgi:hypothetical protein
MSRCRVAISGWLLCMKIGLFILLVSVGAVCRSQEFQIWNEVDLTASWKKMDFIMPAVVRTDPSLPNPQFVATGLVAFVPLRTHLKLVGGYLFADLPQKSQVAHVPVLAVEVAMHKERLTLMDQNRFEKLFDYGSEPVRYRNLLLLDRSFGRSVQWHGFVDDEIFFDLSAVNFNQNRFQAGAGVHLHPRFLLDLYYLQKNPGAASPTYDFGTILTVNLTRHILKDDHTRNP